MNRRKRCVKRGRSSQLRATTYISPRRVLWASFVLILGFPLSALALPVFPGAEGSGTDTVAGSGRHLSSPNTKVIRVTNLNDTGSGSLRACLEASGPRVCVFETSGTIRIKKDLRIDNPYITVAGQTAPSPGINIRGGGFDIRGNDVLIQHLRVRTGDDLEGSAPGARDSITVRGARRVVIDHVSTSWSIDEGVSTWKNVTTRDVTFSHLLIAEALQNSIHPQGGHSMGMLIGQGTFNLSIHNTLYALNSHRNPKFNPGMRGEFVNNVIYGWGSNPADLVNFSDYDNTGLAYKLNFIGNYFKPASFSTHDAPFFAKGTLGSGTAVYVKGNIAPSRPNNSRPEWDAVRFASESRYGTSSYAYSPKVNTERSAFDAYEYVLKNAGARPADRDSVDERVVQLVRDGKGRIIDCVSGCSRSAGGWPNLAVNTRELSIPSNPNADSNGDGYTNLENWLHQFSAEVELGNASPPQAPELISVDVVE